MNVITRFLSGFGAQRTSYGRPMRVQEVATPVTQVTPTVNAAARELGRAISQAEVIGTGELVPMDWADILYRTTTDLYLEGCAYWHFVEGVEGVSLDIPQPGTISETSQGYWYTEFSRVIPSYDLIAFRSYHNPARAVDRLQTAMQVENNTWAGINRAAKDSAFRPRYKMGLPIRQLSDENDEIASRKEVNEKVTATMDSAVATLWEYEDGEQETLEPMQIPRDTQTPSDLNEVRRIVAQDSGVPPPLLGSPDAQTYSNLESLLTSFWVLTITPLAHSYVSKVRAHGRLPLFDLNLQDSPAMLPQLVQRSAAFRSLVRENGMTPQEARDVCKI